MKRINSEKIMNQLKAIVVRFPFTMIFIILLTLWQLLNEEVFFTFEPTFLLLVAGILLSTTSQLLYEHMFREQSKMRWILYGAVILFVVLYNLYLSFSYSQIDGSWSFYSIPGIRTMILYFVTIILFIWVPTIRTKYRFSDTFLVAFKAYFGAAFFSVILFLGIFFTLLLFELLFFSLETNWFSYSSTLVFCLFAPTLFLTFIPEYYTEERFVEEDVRAPDEAIQMPKFLHHLISYILIPVMAVLTAIIVLYILTNIAGRFFEENILEGLLLNYAINGWILLILTDTMDNVIVRWFKRIFPIALIFVVLLQMYSTFLQIQEVGVTHGRYIILLFGVGSIISGIWYLVKENRLRILPIVAMITGLIALVPPFDAMSVSVNQQRGRINEILERHDMMVDADYVIPNPNVPEHDQEKIYESLDYLSEINALNQLEWLPKEYYYQEGVYLGFETEDDSIGSGNRRHRAEVNQTDVTIENQENIQVPIEGFEQFLHLNVGSEINDYRQTIELNGEEYEVEVSTDEDLIVQLSAETLDEPMTFDFT